MQVNHPMNVAKIGINGHFYQVELAISSDQRRLGLMHRTELSSNEGMLLVYSKPGDHRIWMKNVLIPLRIYWIDVDHRIIDYRRVEPCSENPCPVYGASGSSKFVLELSDTDHDIGIGDRVSGLNVLP